MVAAFFDERHPAANIEIIECVVEHAVPVEVDLVTVRCLEEAMGLDGDQPNDTAFGSHRVQLHAAALSSNVVLQPSAGYVKGFADGHT